MSEVNESFFTPGGLPAAVAEVAPELEAELVEEKNSLGDEVFTLSELDKIIELEGAEDPNELIRNRFLCKENAVILAAQTGCGKSSFIMQLAFMFALGLPCFGMTPTRKLKTLIIQGENDKRDLHEEISGIVRGLAHHELIAIPLLEEAKKSVTIRTCTSFSGADFINHLDQVLANVPQQFDLLIIDPLFSFAGVDISKEQGAISQWLRNGLNTLLRRHGIGNLIVHHSNKTSKSGAPANPGFNSTYDYAGSAELANWARGMLVLERLQANDGSVYFRLTAPKRGTRIAPNFCKYLAWAEDGGIYWKEIPPPTIPADAKEAKESQQTDRILALARQAADLLPCDTPMGKSAFADIVKGRMKITSNAKIGKIVAFAIGQGLITERDRKPEDDIKGNIYKVVVRESSQDSQDEQTELSL